MDLQGKRVLVTGASRGIGREIATACAAAGARVALVARNEQAIKELAAALDGAAHPCDLADLEQARGLIERVEADGGPIDVLVNNAGLDAVGGLEQSSAQEVAELLHVDLHAPIELTWQVLPGMVARKAGHIVNVSSFASAAMFPGGTAYAASKGCRTSPRCCAGSSRAPASISRSSSWDPSPQTCSRMCRTTRRPRPGSSASTGSASSSTCRCRRSQPTW